MARAEEMAVAQGLRLTTVRRRVLEVLLEGHRAMGAYEVLQRLAAEGFGNRQRSASTQVEGEKTQPENQYKNICRLHIAGKISSDKKTARPR